MPPKFDPNAEIVLYMRVKGGVSLPLAALAPKVGPYGIPPKIVSDRIFEATQDYKGCRVSLKIVSKNRQPTVTIVPTVSTMIIKALNEGPRTIAKGEALVHKGSVAYDQIVSIAKEIRPRSYSRHFSSTVKEVLGTAHSIGCQVNYKGTNYKPTDVMGMIDKKEIEIEEYDLPFDVVQAE